MSSNPNISEKDFHQEALSQAISQKLGIGSKIVEFQKTGELSASYYRNMSSSRFIFPDTLIENVANRYKI